MGVQKGRSYHFEPYRLFSIPYAWRNEEQERKKIKKESIQWKLWIWMSVLESFLWCLNSESNKFQTMSRPLTFIEILLCTCKTHSRCCSCKKLSLSDTDTCFHLCVDLFYFLFEYMLFFQLVWWTPEGMWRGKWWGIKNKNCSSHWWQEK